ncbi:hypothetical protein [Mesorhizobium neociceri]|uniref:hypothetical protein n=1 Tax=Mesorhizobium neociceri TaxID=1307853 RepID=UPI001F3620F7|nr:hypothetical protein [Mesorhizobium neociceri]
MNTTPATDEAFERRLRELMQLHEAEEMVRKRQQGHGRPMVTSLYDGRRVVVVGKRMVHSAKWQFVSDFMIDNMKHVFGHDWGAAASRSTPDHTLFRWLRKLQEARKDVGGGVALPAKGHLSALNRLAYALYLIEHNDKPLKSLIKRLRHPNDFDPALYEAIVASAFALAGAKIDGAEDAKGNQPKPEFFATFPDGRTYAVEAKRKRSWKASFDLDSEAFVAELNGWLRDKLHGASKKNLDKPVYWFELGIGDEATVEQLERLRVLVTSAVRDAEAITVKGDPPRAAYVFVTNNRDLVNDDASNLMFFGLLMGFAMDDFREATLEIETAMELHDKHRPIRWVHDCLALVQRVPNNFEGVPDELLDERGKPIETLRIGGLFAYPRRDGSEGFGTIEEVTSFDSDAYAIIADEETKDRVMVKVPLTEQEAAAAKKLGNAIFGKPESPNEPITDPLRFYDRMLEIYANYPRESLLNQVKNHARFAELEKLDTEALRVRVAREVTKMLR